MTDNMITLEEYRTTAPTHPVSAVFVRATPSHWRLAVYNRNGYAGDLTILAADGPYVLERLLPFAIRKVGRDDTDPIQHSR